MGETYIFIYNNNYVTVSGDYTYDSDIVANLGDSWQDFLDGKYVMLNEQQISFYETHAFVTPREVFFMEESQEASITEKKVLIDEIKRYDSSEEVNTFYVNNIPVWFNKEVRTSLSNSISIEEKMGKDTTVLWINNTPYTVTVDAAKQMLADLELYAIECYNNTQKNISEVEALTLKSELREFDITKGYPEKLNFNL